MNGSTCHPRVSHWAFGIFTCNHRGSHFEKLCSICESWGNNAGYNQHVQPFSAIFDPLWFLIVFTTSVKFCCYMERMSLRWLGWSFWIVDWLTPKVLWWFQGQNCLKTPLLKASFLFFIFEFFSWINCRIF
jgi:hypothetical protein